MTLFTSEHPGGRRRPRIARSLGLLALIPLAACKPAKTVDFYRQNPLDRESMINHCLATNSNNWNCLNAITAEAERWGTKDVDGYTVMLSGTSASVTNPDAAPAEAPVMPVLNGAADKPAPPAAKH